MVSVDVKHRVYLLTASRLAPLKTVALSGRRGPSLCVILSIAPVHTARRFCLTRRCNWHESVLTDWHAYEMDRLINDTVVHVEGAASRPGLFH